MAHIHVSPNSPYGAESGLSPRATTILKHLVQQYIQDGIPVGSKIIAAKTDPAISPATVRHVMGDLEDKGYISSLHKSSGRVPTDRGYRFFVDSLLKVHPLALAQSAELTAQLDPNQPTSELINSTSNLLSELTSMVAIVSVPRQDKIILRHVEFLQLSDNRVLVILVVNEKEVQNRIIVTDRKYTATDLSQASEFLNQHFAGKDLKMARQELHKALEQDRIGVDRLMQAVVDVAGKAFENSGRKSDYVLAGQENLLHHNRVDIDQLQKLFETFQEKRKILRLLDHCIRSQGIQLYIGEESQEDVFHTCSVITSCYTVNGEVLGVLGVIGPTRMRYDKVIPIVDLTAKILGTALNSE
ncbi:MAG TPA: heat-inducible transcriptional repressor HrcA [Gammaproteobacteria bacterium]|nr:heat-inducible transcriptional repressor HrcA [Gammaproteobacteria bacterium]